jgi:hypothetical protein
VFNPRYGGPQRTQRKRSSPFDPLGGFGSLGLGDPTTLWFASDQVSGLAPFTTRFGHPWSVVDGGVGSVNYDATGWSVNLAPLVQISGVSGIATVMGLECNAAASGSTTLQFDYTYACPIKFPAAHAGVSYFPFAETNGDVAATNSRVTAIVITSATQYGMTGAIAGSSKVPPTIAAQPIGFNVSTAARGLYVATSQVRGGNRVWQIKLRTTLGTLSATSAAITNVNTGNALDTFTMGYRNVPGSEQATNLGFGGGVRWSVGASDAQLTAILDNWARFYPL